MRRPARWCSITERTATWPACGQWGDNYLREARANVDGIRMKAAIHGRKILTKFFDVKGVLDPARPPSISATT
jgi:hypothetical protein